MVCWWCLCCDLFVRASSSRKTSRVRCCIEERSGLCEKEGC